MNEILTNFILQSQTTNLKTSKYPKEFLDFEVKVSFGMGTPAYHYLIKKQNELINSRVLK
ncbi:MAG: hypothetical protein ACPH9P_05335 [Flavobacteriaceae bacterium]